MRNMKRMLKKLNLGTVKVQSIYMLDNIFITFDSFNTGTSVHNFTTHKAMKNSDCIRVQIKTYEKKLNSTGLFLYL